MCAIDANSLEPDWRRALRPPQALTYIIGGHPWPNQDALANHRLLLLGNRKQTVVTYRVDYTNSTDDKLVCRPDPDIETQGGHPHQQILVDAGPNPSSLGDTTAHAPVSHAQTCSVTLPPDEVPGGESTRWKSQTRSESSPQLLQGDSSWPTTRSFVYRLGQAFGLLAPPSLKLAALRGPTGECVTGRHLRTSPTDNCHGVRRLNHPIRRAFFA